MGLGDKMAAKRKQKRRVSTPKIHVPETELKLDLCCGQTVQPGFEGVDLHAPNAKHRIHLWNGQPWPWADSSVSELYCSHGIEHIDAAYLPNGKDAWLWFFGEAWRVTKPGGTFKVIWPALQSVRAFQDPSHRRFIPLQSMMYLDKNWLEMNKLSHYVDGCDWVMEGGTPTCSVENSKKPDAVQQRLYVEAWNFSDDFHVNLRARKA